jgi:dienelactone hydrolase
LTDQLERVAMQALARRKPARLSWGVGRVGFAANRRSHRLKPIDHDLPVLRVEGEDGAVTALFTSYACHCTTIAIDQIHGDWAGVAQAALEREFPGAIALTALGCGADQNPTPRRTMELVQQYGDAVAAEAKRLATQPLRRIGGPLACRTQVLDLAYDTLPKRSEWEAAAAGSGAAAYQAKKNLSRLDRGERLPTHLPYRIQTWVFGEDLAMVFLAGEVVVDYGLRLKREFDAGRLWVNAYANDVPCYIPSRRVLDEGGYEAVGAMIYYDRPTRLAAEVEDQIINGVHRLMPAAFRATGPVDPMAGVAEAPEYPDHAQLEVVRDSAGRERPVQSAADWAERVAHIRSNLQRAMGPLPGASRWTPLDPFVVSEEATSTYVRRKIRYSPEPGDRVPAWLLIPKQLPASGRAPAMLCLHQTTLIGKDEPAGLGGLKTLHYAHELAERGYVCLVPDYPSFGEYPYDFQKEGRHDASGSMKAIWNNQRGIDFLETLPEVDRTRIGVIGHSLGGHNAIFTAVFDERLKAVVSSCGFTPFHDYYGGKLAGWTSDRYMPRIRTVYGNDPDRVPFDFYELLAALAPRGFFSCSPTRDDNFSVAGVQKAFARVAPVYARMEAAERFVLRTPDAPHAFPDADRLAAYEWLDRILK